MYIMAILKSRIIVSVVNAVNCNSRLDELSDLKIDLKCYII